MAKIVRKEGGQTLDAEKVKGVLQELKGMQIISKQGEVAEEVKGKLINYLELMSKLLNDVEHSKISISKLQKLFGFYEEEVKTKEV